MAEYDRSFIDRIMFMTDEEITILLQALSPEGREAMEEAIFRALGQRAWKEYRAWLLAE